MSLAEDAKFGTLDRWAEPNNLDDFEPHGDLIEDEHGSDYWHEITDERLRCLRDPREALVQCGNCYPELLTPAEEDRDAS